MVISRCQINTAIILRMNELYESPHFRILSTYIHTDPHRPSITYVHIYRTSPNRSKSDIRSIRQLLVNGGEIDQPRDPPLKNENKKQNRFTKAMDSKCSGCSFLVLPSGTAISVHSQFSQVTQLYVLYVQYSTYTVL